MIGARIQKGNSLGMLYDESGFETRIRMEQQVNIGPLVVMGAWNEIEGPMCLVFIPFHQHEFLVEKEGVLQAGAFRLLASDAFDLKINETRRSFTFDVSDFIEVATENKQCCAMCRSSLEQGRAQILTHAAFDELCGELLCERCAAVFSEPNEDINDKFG